MKKSFKFLSVLLGIITSVSNLVPISAMNPGEKTEECKSESGREIERPRRKPGRRPREDVHPEDALRDKRPEKEQQIVDPVLLQMISTFGVPISSLVDLDENYDGMPEKSFESDFDFNVRHSETTETTETTETEEKEQQTVFPTRPQMTLMSHFPICNPIDLIKYYEKISEFYENVFCFDVQCSEIEEKKITDSGFFNVPAFVLSMNELLDNPVLKKNYLFKSVRHLATLTLWAKLFELQVNNVKCLTKEDVEYLLSLGNPTDLYLGPYFKVDRVYVRILGTRMVITCFYRDQNSYEVVL